MIEPAIPFIKTGYSGMVRAPENKRSGTELQVENRLCRMTSFHLPAVYKQ
jgi:hypothetical protein